MKLRYDPLDICKKIAANEARNHNLPETSPGFFISTPQLFTDHAKEKYVKEVPKKTEMQRVVRVVDNCKNGAMVIAETSHVCYKPLSFKYKEQLMQGYRFHSYVKKAFNTKLFISNKGAVQFNNGKKSRYLGFQTLNHFGGIPMLPELLSIQPNNAWLEPLITNNLKHINGLTMDIVRKCSSLQEFIDTINLTGTPIKAEWFKDRTLTYIMNSMDAAINFTNPEVFVQDNLSDVEEKQVWDLIKLCKELSIKVTYDKSNFKQQKTELYCSIIEKNTQTILSTGEAKDLWYLDHFDF